MSAPPFAAPRLPRELRGRFYLLNHAPRRGKPCLGQPSMLQLGRNSLPARVFPTPRDGGQLQPALSMQRQVWKKFRASLTWKVPDAALPHIAEGKDCLGVALPSVWLAGSSVNGAPQVVQGRSRM